MAAEWTKRDQDQALADGWGIFDNSDHGMRIERFDQANKFKSDAAASAHVAMIAIGGGPHARKAWRYLAHHYSIKEQ